MVAAPAGGKTGRRPGMGRGGLDRRASGGGEGEGGVGPRSGVLGRTGTPDGLRRRWWPGSRSSSRGGGGGGGR